MINIINFKTMAKKEISGNKIVKCMNHDPENSKWGQYAPNGGCKEMMSIDINSTRGLCSRCTSRSVTNMNDFGPNTGYLNEEE
jgi:hypothetical protein